MAKVCRLNKKHATSRLICPFYYMFRTYPFYMNSLIPGIITGLESKEPRLPRKRFAIMDGESIS